ncbi:MAG: response regulator [Rhodospirillaceae bacterium]|jgi:two-component system, OmpR family, KDP operon response regulator KdpE|nr:response regulator [Rhodospirillaceae bacterium]MBT6119425.1 response regulator [Rhodospirillaceae bacterium]
MAHHPVFGGAGAKKDPQVLVVDDDPEQLRQIAGFLQGRGIAVLSELDGQAAIAAIKHHGPKVVVMDVNMPGMDGIEAAREAMSVANRPVVILMSGEPDKVRKASASDVEVFAVIDKPVPLRVLEQFIRRAMVTPRKPV